MKQRCSNPNFINYRDYGGRGITVCWRWRKFENFLTDVGQRPDPGYSLDRYPNNDGNYEPGNVRWATSIQQGRNRRNTVFVEWKGRRMPLVEACEMEGVYYPTARAKFRAGRPLDKILLRRAA